MAHAPDFIIIGAMKCATSTLHEQLARQPGFFMTEPKEPNYFSDEDIYARGPQWYADLFAGSDGSQLRGESSTHYTKRPTHPRAFERISTALPDIKCIYMMRHPIDRLISHYIHDWTERKVSVPIDQALDRHPDLIAYSRYDMQLAPYVDFYGPDRVLPIFLKHFTAHGQAELERVCTFLGYHGAPRWAQEQTSQNVSSERLRMDSLTQFIVEQPVLQALRRRFVPRAVRDLIKGRYQMRERPQLSDASLARLRDIFDDDLARLGARLGVPLNCDNFDAVTGAKSLEWANA